MTWHADLWVRAETETEQRQALVQGFVHFNKETLSSGSAESRSGTLEARDYGAGASSAFWEKSFSAGEYEGVHGEMYEAIRIRRAEVSRARYEELLAYREEEAGQ